MTKVLFLDVDGVLNCYATWEVIQEENCIHRVDSIKIDRLKQIIENTDCKIVLTSTWRKVPEAVKFLETLFPIYDKTDTDGKLRGEEIQRYIDKHNITHYCIVDDDGDMLDHQLKYFVQTDPEFGLTETLAYRVNIKLQ